MENYIHAAKVGRHSSMELAQSYLKGYASTWWRTVRQKERKNHGCTWELFKERIELGLPQLWGPITSCANLRLQCGLKQSCSLCQDLSNGMLHITCTRGNQGNPRLLMVGSQIVNLILGLSFGDNLCFRCPNGSCEPILNI